MFKKTNLAVLIILLAFGFLLLAFAPVFAFHGLPADTSHDYLVPNTCGSLNACTICDIFILIQSVYNFLVWFITLPLAGLMLAFGGALLVLPYLGASQKMYDWGRAVLTQAVVGILIVFVAWLAIDTIIKVVASTYAADPGKPGIIFADYSEYYFPWNEIKCEAPEIKVTTPPPGPPPLPPPASNTCTGCANLSVPAKPGACANTAQGQTCQVVSELNDKLVTLNSAIADDGKLAYWRVTEAWPPNPDIPHKNSCHPNATCVDANLIGSYKGNPAEIKYFIGKANNAGLKPVYEVLSDGRRNELIAVGVPQDNVKVVSWATGEHFSIYKE